MQFYGRVWKTEEKLAWVIEVPSFGIMTQGHTRKEALAMLKDAIEELIYSYFNARVKVEVNDHGHGVLGFTCQDKKYLLSLSLIKQRQESRMTIREVASRLGSKSPNAYAKYEKGVINISIEKFDELISAVNPSLSGLMVGFC
jgi:predicted RNase H-like HicB family nuclease